MTGLPNDLLSDVILDFGDFPGEYRALTASVGVVPLPSHTEIELAGDERAEFLNRLCTNKVARLAPGTGAEAFLTDAKAHIVAYVFVFAGPHSLTLFSLGAHASSIQTHLDRYLIREKVAIRDRAGEWAAMLLAGPDSQRVLSRFGPRETPATHLSHTRMEIEGVEAAVSGIDLGGRMAFLVVVEGGRRLDLWGSLCGAGARPCGWQAANAVRIEAGWPIYGLDITADNLPQEVARDDRTLSFNKGCYLGQETIARIDSRGHVNRTLVGLRFHGTEPPASGAPLIAEGQPAGTVTSAAFSPGSGVAVGLGYVRRGSNSRGFVVQSAVGLAEVTSLPMSL